MRSKISSEEKSRMYEETIPIASELRRSFISDSEVIEDTFQMIEQLGYLLVRFPARNSNSDLSGFYIKKGNQKCIYVNTNNNLGRQYFSVWHEFYHAETGDGQGLSYTYNSDIDPSEYRANITAGYILMPDDLVYNYVSKQKIAMEYISYDNIIRMQNYFKVGYSALISRLIQLFPEHKRTLSVRYRLSKIGRRSEMEEKVQRADGDIKLITPTNDVYFPKTFLDDIEYNVAHKRITAEKALNIMRMVEGLDES